MTARAWAVAAEEHSFDVRRGISTAGVVQIHSPGLTTNYQAVHPRAMKTFLGHLPDLERGRCTFVDLGSGRGRAVMLAIESGFGGALGIELEAHHHELALANLRSYRLRFRGRAASHPEDITLLLGDARTLELPPGPLVLFLYNPFGRDVLEVVLRNALAQLCAAPRAAWLIYEAPAHRDLLDAGPAFTLIAERTSRRGSSPRRPRYAVYRIGPDAEAANPGNTPFRDQSESRRAWGVSGGG